jgi:hypothetical protein
MSNTMHGVDIKKRQRHIPRDFISNNYVIQESNENKATEWTKCRISCVTANVAAFIAICLFVY